MVYLIFERTLSPTATDAQIVITAKLARREQRDILSRFLAFPACNLSTSDQAGRERLHIGRYKRLSIVIQDLEVPVKVMRLEGGLSVDLAVSHRCDDEIPSNDLHSDCFCMVITSTVVLKERML